MKDEYIRKDLLLEAVKKLDTYAWTDFCAVIDGLPTVDGQDIIDEACRAISREVCDAVDAAESSDCQYANDCPLLAYERTERRYWQSAWARDVRPREDDK